MEKSPIIFWTILGAVEVLLATSFLLFPPSWFCILTLLIISLIFFVKPNWGAYLLILVIPVATNQIGFIYYDFVWARNQVFPIYILILALNICFVIILKTIHKQRSFGANVSLVFFMLVFAGYSLLSLTFAQNTKFSLIVIALLFANMALYFYFLSMFKNIETHKYAMKVFVIAGLAGGALTFYSIMSHPQYSYYQDVWDKLKFVIYWDPRVKLRGYALEQPNFTSMMLNLSACIVIGLMLSSNKTVVKCLYAVLLTFFIFTNCLTSSKGGLGAFLLTSYFIIVFSAQLRRRFYIAIPFVTIFIIALFIVSVEFTSLYGDPKHAELAIGKKEISLSSRIDMWEDGFRALGAENFGFLKGLGIGGYSYITRNLWAHNLVFSFYFDFGVVGLIFLGGLFFHIVRELLSLEILFRTQKSYIEHMVVALTGGFLAIMIHSAVDFHYNQSMLWTYLALLLGTIQIAKAKKNKRRLLPSERQHPYTYRFCSV